MFDNARIGGFLVHKKVEKNINRTKSEPWFSSINVLFDQYPVHEKVEQNINVLLRLGYIYFN